MKEAITETRPLVLDVLLKIPANFYVVTEWTPLARASGFCGSLSILSSGLCCRPTDA